MDVVVAGGHGQIALKLLRLLAERGDRARGLVRNPDHVSDLEAVGAEAVLCDLELAAKANRIGRYVIVSAIGAAHPERASGAMRPYIEAKAEADERLAGSGLDWTIVRPGRLTDERGTGLIRAGSEIGSGEVPREDVAATLAAVLRTDTTVGKAFDLLAGDTPVEAAVRAL